VRTCARRSATDFRRWQRYWDEHGAFRATRRNDRPKRYILDISPYPSGVGLHVGRPEGYTATDIMAPLLPRQR
jgi:leucyl-tRNA synthetase